MKNNNEKPRIASELVVGDICYICWSDTIEAGVFRGIETLPKSGWKHAVVFTREFGCRRIDLCHVFKNYNDAKADWIAGKRRQIKILQDALNPNRPLNAKEKYNG